MEDSNADNENLYFYFFLSRGFLPSVEQVLASTVTHPVIINPEHHDNKDCQSFEIGTFQD